MTDTPIPFGSKSQSLSDVEVVLTDRITQVAGTVTDDRGRAVADARVVVFAADRDLWYDRSRFVKIAAADANGAFCRPRSAAGHFVSAVDRRQASEENGSGSTPICSTRSTPGAANPHCRKASLSANPTLDALAALPAGSALRLSGAWQKLRHRALSRSFDRES
jgi:hypothetical protein